MSTRDSLGRATFHHIARTASVRPTAREIRWFQHIDRHGPQSSQHLFELTKNTHRCRDSALRQLQKLRASGFLRLPPQQRATEKADFNPYVYDLTKAARDNLVDLGLAEPNIRPTGHWWHAYLTACVTSAIEIAARRQNIQYIPTHKILGIKNAPLAIAIGRDTLIPDQLFALNYGNSFRAFALEVDRGTEPKISSTKRKSYQRSITLYRQLIEQQLHKPHYGLKANLLVLCVFTKRSNQQRFLDLLKNEAGPAAATILTQTTPDPQYDRRGFTPNHALFTGDWQRAGHENVNLSAV